MSAAEIYGWCVLIEWLGVALVLFYDSAAMHGRARRQYNLAKRIGNGRVVVARFRRMISRWYIVASTIALALGLLAVYRKLYLPHPPPDTQLASIIIQQGIVVMLFAIWRTKRANVILQRQLDERTEGKLTEIARDTNQRIRDVQERLDE